MRFDWKIALLAVAAAVVPALAQADDERLFDNTLTGNWDGWRSWLLGYGFNFTLGYTTETAGNAQGGTKQSVRYTDQWALGITVDLYKVLGLHDTTLQATITDRNGRNHLGTIAEVWASGQALAQNLQVDGAYAFARSWRDLLRAIDHKAKVSA